MRTTNVDPRLLRGTPVVLLGASDGAGAGAASSEPLTAEEAAEALLRIREQLAATWPRMKKLRGKLTRSQMEVWNAAVYQLLDMELKLVAELSRSGVTDATGKPLAQVVNPATLQKRLQAGFFVLEGGSLGALPIIAGAIGLWLLKAAGVTVALGLVASLVVYTFNRAKMAELANAATALDLVSKGKADPSILDKLPKADPSGPPWGWLIFGVAALGAGFWYLNKTSSRST